MIALVSYSVNAQVRLLQRVSASEEDRMNSTALWFGHKSCRPPKTKENRRGWSLEDLTEGSYVCFQAEESSEYFDTAGFEVGKVLLLPSEISEEAELHVEYQQFDT